MEVLAVLLSLFAAGIVSLALYFRRLRGHLETLGIPIDPPMLMFGSSPRAMHKVRAWLPDGYSRIFRIVCVWPFGLLDYGSATLRCKI